MFLSFISEQVEQIFAKQDSWVDVVKNLSFFIFLFLLGLIIAIMRKISEIRDERYRRACTETDEKLMSILKSELPNYDYAKLKLEILSFSPGRRCPRCRGVLDYSVDTMSPIQCSKWDCRYTKPLTAPPPAEDIEELFEN